MPHTSVLSVIQSLGGGSRIAAHCKCGAPAISNWISDGAIPKSRWPDLIRMAEQIGVELTLDDMWTLHNSRAPVAA